MYSVHVVLINVDYQPSRLLGLSHILSTEGVNYKVAVAE